MQIIETISANIYKTINDTTLKMNVPEINNLYISIKVCTKTNKEQKNEILD